MQLLVVDLLLLFKDHHLAKILVLVAHLAIDLTNHYVLTMFELQDS